MSDNPPNHSTVAAQLRRRLFNFPLRYEDWNVCRAAQLQHGQTAAVEGVIVDIKTAFGRGGKRQMLAAVQDADGGIVTARFFNVTAALERSMTIGRRLRLLGTARLGRGWEMAHPKIQSAAADGKMLPVYTAASGISQDKMRQQMRQSLAAVAWPETVPPPLRQFDGGALSVAEALHLIHSPPPADNETIRALHDKSHPAWRRLRFDELLAHQIILQNRRRRRCRQTAPPIATPPNWDAPLRKALPFKLTDAQEKAVADIVRDLQTARPMQRLLQGDVGSGKTAVAAFALFAAATAGHVGVLMAPTEILAQQHYQTLSEWFRAANIQCECITGVSRGRPRREALARLRLGLSKVAIGTHALFQEESHLPSAALFVIDEQHRFGVAQRKALAGSGGNHQLMMSATPIPRTLALSAFADLDMSILGESPPGRGAVRTHIIPCLRRAEVLARLHKQSTAYWVCPLIDNTDSDAQLQDVFSLAEQVRRDYPTLASEILHGRLAARDKQEVINRFRNGQTRLLIATTVIEVGVDVPQADVMVIDHAERMGLSQLHQLRGRVGRGGQDGVCILLYADNLSDDAKARLKILHNTTDGFQIAEADLRLRGSGEWLGTKQSGLPSFHVSLPEPEQPLIEKAADAARWLLENDRRTAAAHIRPWLSLRQTD